MSSPTSPSPRLCSADIVIVGAGQAGFQLAVSLRQKKYAGSIVLIGDEHYPPYHRPPLSKAALKEGLEAHNLWFRPDGFLERQAIEERRGERVVAIDRAAKHVHFTRGETLSYGTLVLATGATPRSLPASLGAPAAGAFVLRTLEDALALRPRLESGGCLAIIGAGYIGLEVAASARILGVEVHVIDREERIMQRTTSPAVSATFKALHERHGVHLHLSATLDKIEETATGPLVHMSGKDPLACDHVLAGIGVIPNVDLAETAGLAVNDGIVADAQGRTSDDAIFAIGDCARHAHAGHNEPVRFESVQSAIDQAKVVADVLVGADAEHSAVPWFWSDQYDTKLQTVGVADGATQMFRRGEEGDESLALYHVKADRLVAVEAINAPQDFVRARKQIASDAPFDPSAIEGLVPA